MVTAVIYFLKRCLPHISLCAGIFLCSLVPTVSSFADGAYGSGTYGSCEYSSCSIALTTSGTVSINTTPAGGTRCTVAKDTVTVTTNSSTGYTMTLLDNDSTNKLSDGSGNFINPISGSAASPTLLSGGVWGYRVDGISGFGAGPTSAVSNGTAPTQTFAALPASTSTADPIASTSDSSNPTVATAVWYGICASTATRSGTYSDTVVYTAVVN